MAGAVGRAVDKDLYNLDNSEAGEGEDRDTSQPDFLSCLDINVDHSTN